MAASNEIIQIDELVPKLTALNATLQKTAADYLTLIKNIEKGNTTAKEAAVTTENLNKTQKETNENTKQKDALNKQLAASEEKLLKFDKEIYTQIQKNNIALADKKKAINETIKAEGAASDSLVKMKQKLKELESGYETMSKAAREKAAPAINALSREIGKAELATNRGQRNVGQYRNSLEGMTVTVSNLTQKQRQLDLSTKSGQQQFKAIQTEIDRTKQKMTTLTTASTGVAGSFANIGKKLLGAFGVIGGLYLFANAVRDTFKRIREFDKAMQNMAGIAGVTRSELAGVEEEIKKVAGSSVKTSNQVAELAEVLFTLGKTKQDVINMLEPVNNLAIGLETTSENAAELLGQTLNAFGKGSESASDFADIIANMRTSTALNFERIKDALGYLAPTAKAVGLSLGQLGAIIGTLQDNGVDAARAGALMNTSFARLVGKGLTLNDALLQINNSTNKVKDAGDLFGKRAFGLGLILADNTDKLKSLGDEFDNLSSGSLKKLTDEQLKSLDSKIKILDSTWEKFLLDLDSGSGVIASVARGFIWALTGMIEALGDIGKSWYDIVGEMNANAVMAASKNALHDALIQDKKDVEELAKALESKGTPATESHAKAIQLTILQYQRLIGYGVKNKDQIQKQIDALTELGNTSGKETQEQINARENAEAAAEAAKELSYLGTLEKRLQDIAKEREKLIVKGAEGTFKIADEKQMAELETQARDINTLISDIKDALSYEEMGASMQIVMDAQINAAKENAKITGATELELQEAILKIKKDSYGMAIMMDGKMLMKKQMNNQIITEMERSMIIANAENQRQAISDLEELQEKKKFTLEAFSDFEREILKANMSDEEKKTADIEDEYNKRMSLLSKYLENKIITEEQYVILEGKIMTDADQKEFDNLYDLEKKKADEQKKADDKRIEQEKDIAEKIKDIQFEIASEIVNGVFDLRAAKRDEELSALDKEREKKLDNDKLTAEQKDKINAEYDKKAAAIKTKQAKSDKLQAMFNIALSTFKGTMSAAAMPPLFAANPMIPWLIALGAVQLGLVAAQPIPKFAKGGTAEKGFGIFGEAGRELMFPKSGGVMMANKATYFEGSKFKGAQIVSNPDTERMIAAAERSGVSGRGMTDERIVQGLSNLERTLRNKPVQIVDRDYKPIGYGNSTHQTIYLNKLTGRN